VRELLVEMIVGGVSLEVVDELRSATTTNTDCSLHTLLTDALTSAVNTLRLVSLLLLLLLLIIIIMTAKAAFCFSTFQFCCTTLIQFCCTTVHCPDWVSLHFLFLI